MGTGAVSYAAERVIHDADSHVMELSGWLAEHADPGIRDRIRPLYLGGAGALADDAVRQAEARAGDEAAALALEGELLTRKGRHALGAFDPAERSRAMDLLGFESQLVFATFAATRTTPTPRGPRIRSGGSRRRWTACRRLLVSGSTPATTPT